jgi:hypothetical protein
LPGSAFDWPGHTNLASGIHHEAYDCDNHDEAAEHAAKLEAGLLPSNINVLIFDHLISAVEQRECGMVRALGHATFANRLSVRAGTETALVG